uniref:GDSL esterase/lipase n=1 Tax=Arundo donax TaxID=35708 RepID=A0A0A9CDA7_ARUDO
MELRRLLCVVAAVSWALAVARCDPQVPCYFIFGDSLVDNGNNNFIVSLARANSPPYGIDFAGGPSGRFTNGLTTVDVIGKLARVTHNTADAGVVSRPAG